jgi:hypothetical protein
VKTRVQDLLFTLNVHRYAEVQGRAKDSPPPTPRIRGTPSSSPRLSPHNPPSSTKAGAASASRFGASRSPPSQPSPPAAAAEASGWTSVVVLYTTSMSMAGLYKLNPVDPQRESARFRFQPLSL